MKERIRMGVSKDDQFDLNFIDGKLPDVYDMVIGRHHICDGFVTKTATSRGLNYFLVCGKCCLRIEVPEALKTKKALIDFFTEKGFHRPGEEVNVCLDCEGWGWRHQEKIVKKESCVDNRPCQETHEVTERIDCEACRGTGILQEQPVG